MVVGVHTLEKIVPNMMVAAGFHGKYTLHSLRATCATRLYLRGVDEQLIAEITGHSSTAIREYKRTDDNLKRRICEMLDSPAAPSMETGTVVKSCSCCCHHTFRLFSRSSRRKPT